MPFNSESFEGLLPTYLTRDQKDRLKEALKQFKLLGESSKGDSPTYKDWSPKLYTDFYTTKRAPYFLQGDIIREVRFPLWDAETASYTKAYLDGIIITNTCDMDLSNDSNRAISKKILFAPVVPLEEFLKDIEKPKISQLERTIKDQQLSNIFYLPKDPIEEIDYVVSFDQLSWLPSEEFQTYLTDIDINRKVSLDFFGIYLFALKLSYHFCRLPEDNHRLEWCE